MTTAERIADVLAEHREVITKAKRTKVSCHCTCGFVICPEQKVYAPQGKHDSGYRAHVAAVIAALFDAGERGEP